MPSRRDKIGAGVFLLTALLLAFATVVVVAGLTLGRRIVSYDIRFSDSVHGLTSGSDVVYLGVHVGKVRDVTTEVGAVVVTVEVARGTPVKTGTFAILDTNLLTGSTTIELRGGQPGEDALPEGSEIRWERDTLSAVQDSLPGAVGGVMEIVLRLQELLRPENRARVESILATVDEELPRTAQALRETLAEWRSVPQSARSLGEKLETEIGGAREALLEPLNSTLAEFRTAAHEVARTAESLRGLSEGLTAGSEALPASLERLDRVLERMDETLVVLRDQVEERGDDAGRSIESLRRTSRALERLLADLEENPWMLVRGAPSEETGPVDR